jgi:UPF0271 protein
MSFVDLNSDLGESFGTYTIGNDAEILKHVTSANIACGFHAGDPDVMEKTVTLAVANGVAIGAHPGMPDLVGFGRRKLDIKPSEAYSMVVYQVGALAAFAHAHGVKLQHVKPHGALYNMAGKDAALAQAIAKAVHDVNPNLILFGLAGSQLIKQGEAAGLKTASEVFADRTYQPDGSLTPRSQPDAMVTDEDESIARILRMVKEGVVRCQNGTDIPVQADTICVHGDGAKALAFTERIHSALVAEGVEVKSFR